MKGIAGYVIAAVAGKVVAVCQWLHDALRVAGVPREKLLLCRQGVPLGAGPRTDAGGRRANEVCRGRFGKEHDGLMAHAAEEVHGPLGTAVGQHAPALRTMKFDADEGLYEAKRAGRNRVVG